MKFLVSAVLAAVAADDLQTLIGGDGTLRVRTYGGKKGLVILLR